MLLTAEDVPATARAVHRRLKAETGAPGLVMSGRPATDRPDWAATFTRTARCLSVAKALGDADRAVSTQDYELYALAFDPARDQELRHFLGAGRHQLPLAGMGAAMGSNVRVGLEDSLWLGPGRLAESNAHQVERIRTILESLSLEVATPDEARRLLALKGADRVGF